MIALSNRTLAELPPAVGRPRYDRARLKPGIVHFGIGNFHRAHQATYLDALFNRGQGHDWAIIGAGVRPDDRAMRADLEGQDWLTTVVEQDGSGSDARVIASMSGFLPVGDPAAIIAQLADPAIRIVSLTVTEGGYFVDPATGEFDAAHPELIADAARPDRPSTVFGLILAGLTARRTRGLAPFTVMSCDNLPHNGDVTRRTLIGLARLSDRSLADWAEVNVAFPNGMVDRITPATSERERRLLRDQFGIRDARPVFCERFTQWVLEDRFPAGRPPLEEVGVTFVENVSPFELMKIRMLNGGHAAIAYPAGLLDIHFVHEAMGHPLIRAFLDKLEADEIIPTVPPVPGTDLNVYRRLIEDRFANPKIGDTVRRLCLDGSNRQPKFILPTVRDRLQKGGGITGLALVSAFWCRYCAGVTEKGAVIEPNDPSWDRLRPVAAAAKDEPKAWLGLTDIFGSLADNPAYIRAFTTALATIWRDGTEATLQAYLHGRL
ncbi:MAG TPA: mannitol dehydrogenase family protein [Bauldia sp.]|nr:mannitol dehydrogenase family protein [Bauldia sp.]